MTTIPKRTDVGDGPHAPHGPGNAWNNVGLDGIDCYHGTIEICCAEKTPPLLGRSQDCHFPFGLALSNDNERQTVKKRTKQNNRTA